MSIFELLLKHQQLLLTNNQTKISNQEIEIVSNNHSYFKINHFIIELFGININNKLSNKNSQDKVDRFNNYFSFVNAINQNIIRLNHIGFGYKISDIDQEIKCYKQALPDDFEIVEENSGDLDHNRWFFIKHKTNKSLLKIELVLYPTYKYKSFIPQFQIDIDTNLSYEELKQLTDKYINNNFFFWSYNIPNRGVVMAMGKIGVLNGVNILLGLGTNLRKSPRLNKM